MPGLSKPDENKFGTTWRQLSIQRFTPQRSPLVGMTRAHEKKAAKRKNWRTCKRTPKSDWPCMNSHVHGFHELKPVSGLMRSELNLPKPEAQWYLKFLVSVKTPSFTVAGTAWSLLRTPISRLTVSLNQKQALQT